MTAKDVPSRLDEITTRWSLLRAAHDASGISAHEARNALVLRYMPAVRRYVGAMLSSSQEADDVTQDLVVRFLAGDFAGADPQRGRFRDLLKVAVRNMVRSHWAWEKRRRGVALDIDRVPADEDDSDQCWAVEWRQSVLDLVWKALEQHQQARPGSMAFTLLRLRTAYPDDSSDQLAARLSEQTGQALRPRRAAEAAPRAGPIRRLADLGNRQGARCSDCGEDRGRVGRVGFDRSRPHPLARRLEAEPVFRVKDLTTLAIPRRVYYPINLSRSWEIRSVLDAYLMAEALCSQQ